MSDLVSTQDLIIILTTVIPSAVFIVITTILCCRARRRRARLFERSITPIDDEEILSWKMDRTASEKSSGNEAMQDQQSQMGRHHNHRSSTSVGSIQKPASVIIYQDLSYCYNPPSYEDRQMMPLPMPRKESMSMDLTSIPVLARAPNSRPGLTDEAVQGEDAFIPPQKRHTARLSKLPAPPRHCRSKSTRATMSSRSPWYGQAVDHQLLPRRSADTFFFATRPASEAMDSPFSTPRRGSLVEEISFGGLSPRPIVPQSEIGRAIG
ncbi:hypothetical protein E4U43_002395 [Claviceps pusilla]|uniref:Uncharacterized protein n=1 Tax=Claviceps pusilla TaxID=123648 RepID=A0A9P7SW58_9HYPO|nr:hypothetical protein E4U43_002395 [Claviceps pusilla]